MKTSSWHDMFRSPKKGGIQYMKCAHFMGFHWQPSVTNSQILTELNKMRTFQVNICISGWNVHFTHFDLKCAHLTEINFLALAPSSSKVFLSKDQTLTRVTNYFIKWPVMHKACIALWCKLLPFTSELEFDLSRQLGSMGH